MGDSNVTIGSTGLDTILNAGTDLRAEFGDGTGLFAVTVSPVIEYH